jgi:hypothetical protein
MQTLELSLNELVHASLVAYDEAVAHSGFPREIDRLVAVR